MATRWACVGPGRIATDFFNAIRDNLPEHEHEFVAVASRELSRARTFAEKFKFKKAYGSYDEVAKDDDVEVVYISTIHISHKSLAIKMLEAGKHVLCEKPLTMNLEDTNEVVETARKNKRLLVEGYWSRCFPAYAQIRKELEAGNLGDIRLVQANFVLDLVAWKDFCDPRLGGGGMSNIGGYLASLVTMVFKEMPDTIKAVGVVTDACGHGDVDIGCSFILKYKNGATASLMYSIDSKVGNNAAFIVGTNGIIEVSAPFWAPEKVVTPTGTYEFPLKKGSYNFLNTAGLHYEAVAVREAILKGKLEIETMSLEETVISTTVNDEVLRQIGVAYPDFD